MSRPRRGPSDSRAWTTARQGREAALQMLYLWEVGGCDIDSAVQALGQIEPPESSAGAEAHRFGEALARGTVAHLTAIDGLVADRAEHWRLSRMAALDRLILRLAVHELLHLETPPAVVIDEAIELAKRYSTDDSARFVNGVLDAIKRQIDDDPRD